MPSVHAHNQVEAGAARPRTTPGSRRRGRRGALFAAVASALVTLPGGAAHASTRPAGAVNPGQLSWHSCAKTFECTTVPVPLDYSAPSAGTVKLAVVELRSTNPHPLGDLFMNPGGPGASGVQFLEGTPFPKALRASFNLVSWDPRGVGASDPVTCEGAAGIRALVALPPAPTTPTQVNEVVKAAKAFDQACAKNTPRSVLENVSTVDTVRDLDRLRAALGQGKLDYFGFSYGTFIGETYAQMFPTHIRVMVLDGAMDPALGMAATSAGQAKGFQTDLEDFFAWCPTNKTCSNELPLGAQTAYDQLMQGLARGTRLYANLKPMYGGRQQVTLGVAETAVLGSLYSDQSWPYLAQGIATGLNGDGSLLAALAYSYQDLQPNGQFGNLSAANSAVNCLDQPYPKDLSAYQALAVKLAKVSPDFGASMAWGNLGCAYWPVPATGRAAPVHSSFGPHILVIGSTDDPATPYPWAQAVSKQLGARLLTRKGPGHTGYLYSTCVQRYTNRYLVTKQLPPVGTVCPSSS